MTREVIWHAWLDWSLLESIGKSLLTIENHFMRDFCACEFTAQLKVWPSHKWCMRNHENSFLTNFSSERHEHGDYNDNFWQFLCWLRFCCSCSSHVIISHHTCAGAWNGNGREFSSAAISDGKRDDDELENCTDKEEFYLLPHAMSREELRKKWNFSVCRLLGVGWRGTKKHFYRDGDSFEHSVDGLDVCCCVFKSTFVLFLW